MELRINKTDLSNLSQDDIKKRLIEKGFDLSKNVVSFDDFENRQMVFQQRRVYR